MAYKQKGSPMHRNFGIGSPMKQASPMKWAWLIPVAKAVGGMLAGKVLSAGDKKKNKAELLAKKESEAYKDLNIDASSNLNEQA